MKVRLLVIAVLLVPLGIAAQPAATIFTNGQLAINGVQMANAGVPSFPLAAGDEIATVTSPALIVFPDGSRVTVAKGTKAKLNAEGRRGMEVLSGTAVYKTPALSKFEMRAFGRAVNLESRSEGVVSVTSPDKVTVRAKAPGDDDDIEKIKYKKPHPRSKHNNDGDEP